MGAARRPSSSALPEQSILLGFPLPAAPSSPAFPSHNELSGSSSRPGRCLLPVAGESSCRSPSEASAARYGAGRAGRHSSCMRRGTTSGARREQAAPPSPPHQRSELLPELVLGVPSPVLWISECVWEKWRCSWLQSPLMRLSGLVLKG